MNGAMSKKPGYSAENPSLDVLVATLLYLMTRFLKTGEDELREAVIQHLALLRGHPLARDSRPIRNTTEQLAREWLGFDLLRAAGTTSCRRARSTLH